MPIPRFEVAGGVVDGVNLIFTTSLAYVAGSVSVFLNGQLKRKDFMDGWVEASPSMGLVALNEAPLPASNGNPDDVVQIFYLDAVTPSLPEVEVTPLKGRISTQGEIRGILGDTAVLQGSVFMNGEIRGVLEDDLVLHGQLESPLVLQGRLEAC